MNSAGNSYEHEDETLSSCILFGLRERKEDDAMFVFLSSSSQHSNALTATDGQAGVTEKVVTKRIWSTFVFLLQQHLVKTAPCADHSDDEPQTNADTAESCAMRNPRCDVGVYCSETFYACLTESACLFLGLSFCLFCPDDPPMRLERLERRRRPQHKLRLDDILSLLQSAMDAKADSGVTGVRATPPSHTPVAASSSAPSAPQNLRDSCVAYYMHTSGSTGDPKCVVVSRGNLHAYLRNFIHNRDGLSVTQDPPCRVFCLSSPFFDPSIGDMLAVLCTPQSVFYTCSQETLLNGCAGALMAAVQPTHAVSTPAVWRTISADTFRPSEKSTEDVATSVMKVFLGGERMSQEVIATWAERVELFNIYGVTEVTIYQSVQRVHAGMRLSDMTCGVGVGTRIAIDTRTLDAFHEESSDRRTDSDLGEVVLYGDQVCCGYADEELRVADEEQGSAAPSPFGYDRATSTRFFRTGDIGKLISIPGAKDELQLVLSGRRDWQIKLNGRRVSIEEVEGTVQRSLEGIATQCACFCIKSADLASKLSAPVIGAAIVLADVLSEKMLENRTQGVTEALREVLAFHLPSFMIPRRWLLYVRGSSLPQTATGKVNRTVLARVAGERMRKEVSACEKNEDDNVTEDQAMELHDVLYTTVKSAWELHLGLSVHANTHYLHAGGDSLGALKLTRAIYLRLRNDNGGSDGGDAGIDEHGGLPSPFQPCVLLQHPRFFDYVAFLRQVLDRRSSVILGVELHKDNGTKSQDALLVQPAQGTPFSTPASSTSLINSNFREVVAVQCCALAERLLQHGVVDVNGGNTREHRCITPLHIAVSSCGNNAAELQGAQRMVKLLLDFGAKPTAVSPDGVTPLHLAAAVSAPLLQQLLDNAPSLLHCREGRQQSLLHFAARGGNVEAVQLLLSSYHAKLDTRDKWQRTPVHWAVLNGHVAVLEAMLMHHNASASSPSALKPTATLEGTAVNSSGGMKRTHQQGFETARLARLARKRTYLAYETLCSIARRTFPGDAQMMELCCALSAAVGEEPPSQ